MRCFGCCAKLSLLKANGFHWLSVRYQNIRISCRGGVSPPVTNDNLPHIPFVLDRRGRRSLRACANKVRKSLSSSTASRSPFPAGEGFRCGFVCGITDGMKAENRTITSHTSRPRVILSKREARVEVLEREQPRVAVASRSKTASR